MSLGSVFGLGAGLLPVRAQGLQIQVDCLRPDPEILGPSDPLREVGSQSQASSREPEDFQKMCAPDAKWVTMDSTGNFGSSSGRSTSVPAVTVTVLCQGT